MTATRRNPRPLLAAGLGAILLAAACSSETGTTTEGVATEGVATDESTTTAEATSSDTTSSDTTASDTGVSAADCDTIAALFVTGESVNPDLVDPEVAATCDGETITVVSNGVPDFTYIGTSPGVPDGREFIFDLPAEATMADEVSDVPYVGPIGVTLNGIAIYGPTEGTGGDVDSLPGIISACGSHNGPGGFHTHKILNPSETDCWFAPEDVVDEPQLVGYAFDGFPIYTGIDQYTSSWQLTDESAFATDTWAAHTYVEGSGDLDQCNGLMDADGNYAYYTTEAFPYVLGCFVGDIDIQEAGGGGQRDAEPDGEDGEQGARPERPEDGEDGERPERPEDGEDAERPERPEDGEDAERPARPEEDADVDAEAPTEGEGENG